MLNSIIKGNNVNKLNIDRVTNKNTGSSYRMYFLTIFIISLLLTTFLNNIDFEKYSKLLNNFLIKNGFTINNIQILGIKNITKETIIKIVNNEKKSNIFNVNLLNIYNNLKNNDWVEELYIERVLPNTIKINIKEKEVIGIWQYEMSNKLITKNGETISTANINKFKIDLPIIHGNHANKNANSILEILETNKVLAKNIWSLDYVNNRRWNLHFKQGIIVLLPSKGVLKAWNEIIKLQKNYDVLNLGLTELDLRNPNKILGKISVDKDLINHRKNL
ncbi:FtsQ-type POTRA domain-containing protein [Candidatus Levibacter sp. Uisw_134_01]|uniref:cell division protein FtsQ/DivIB n=1 Tax=Candidatus Levibacter sp. Uisw_134_01 TaxID=3230999 RepID=UPI003D570DFC